MDGVTIGSPVAGHIANLFIHNIERRAMETAVHPPDFYGRYVDDVIANSENQEYAISFNEHINKIQRGINFTNELEKEEEIVFLDVKLKKLRNNTPKLTLYKKNTHVPSFPTWDSNHDESKG